MVPEENKKSFRTILWQALSHAERQIIRNIIIIDNENEVPKFIVEKLVAQIDREKHARKRRKLYRDLFFVCLFILTLFFLVGSVAHRVAGKEFAVREYRTNPFVR